MKRLLPVLIMCGIFITPLNTAVYAQSSEVQISSPQNTASEKMIEDGMKMILGAIELFLKSIPEYQAPEVLENGDIIIRRIQPHEPAPNAEGNTKKGI